MWQFCEWHVLVKRRSTWQCSVLHSPYITPMSDGGIQQIPVGYEFSGTVNMCLVFHIFHIFTIFVYLFCTVLSTTFTLAQMAAKGVASVLILILESARRLWRQAPVGGAVMRYGLAGMGRARGAKVCGSWLVGGPLIGCLSQIKNGSPLWDAVWSPDSKNAHIFGAHQRK